MYVFFLYKMFFVKSRQRLIWREGVENLTQMFSPASERLVYSMFAKMEPATNANSILKRMFV